MLKLTCFLCWVALLSPSLFAASIDTDLQSTQSQDTYSQDTVSRNNVSRQIQGPYGDPQRVEPTQLEIVGDDIAGAIVQATIRYELPFNLQPGAVIKLGQHWTENQRLQVDSPGNLNFVQISSTASQTSGTASAEAAWLAGYRELGGLYGGLESLAPVVAFELTSGELGVGSILSIRIDRLRLPTTVVENYQLPLFVQTDKNAPAVQIPGNVIRVRAADFSRLSLHASSVGRPGESIDVRVRLEDKYGNLALGRPLSLDLLVNGVFQQRISVVDPVQRIENISFDTPGTHHIEVRTGGGGLTATSNPILIGDYPHKIIWADIGRPSLYSEGRSSTGSLVRAASGRYDLALTADPEAYVPQGIGNVVDGISIHSRWQSLEAGGALIRLQAANGDTINIARPELPTDLRRMTPDDFGLVEIVSGGSVYDWFGHQAASDGFRVGFTGSNHSHQYPAGHRPVYTAVWLQHGQSWFEAMQNQQTYVSVGSKIVLVVDRPELSFDPVRHLGLDVAAGMDITSIDVFKNGERYKSHRQQEPQGNQFRLVSGSSSEPAGHVMSRPRNAREWVGYVSALGTGVVVSGSHHPWQIRQGRSSTRFDFYTRTHGLEESQAFTLDGVNADTVIEIGIAPGYEDAAWLPGDRLPEATPAQKFLIPVEEARQGATRSFDVKGYRDRVTVEPALLSLGTSLRYEFDDPSPPRLGDYYYFRVSLADGSFAYTSPIYVGDF